MKQLSRRVPRLTVSLLIALWFVAATAGCNPDDTSGGGNWLDDVEDDTSVEDTGHHDTATEDTEVHDTSGDDTPSIDTSDDVDDTSTDDGGAADWQSCSVPSDCVLADNSCCGVCGEPELRDKDAVNEDQLDAHRREVCPEPEPCPRCVSGTNPYLVASCTDDICQGYDVRRESFTECSTDEDCRLRVRECCECGGTTDPSMLIAVAVGSMGDYAELVCDPGTGCPECVPQYPPEANAVCSDRGHCEVDIQ